MKYAADEVRGASLLHARSLWTYFEIGLTSIYLAMQFKVPAQTSAILTNGKFVWPDSDACN